MSAIPRKTASNALSAAAQKRSAPLPSPQYLDAINYLSEATMAEACALALSLSDYEGNHTTTKNNNNSNGNSSSSSGGDDLSKLLQMEKKTKDAVKVVHKEDIPSPNAWMLPPTMPSIPAARVNLASVVGAAGKAALSGSMVPPKATMVAAPKTLLGVGGGGKPIMAAPGGVNSGGGVGKAGVVPTIRRGSLVGSRGPPGGGGLGGSNKRLMPQQLQRVESDDSSIGSGGNSNKKARLAAAASSADATNAPPPSAMKFLEKLNKEKGPAATITKTESKNNDSNKEKDKDKEKPKEKDKEKPVAAAAATGNDSDGDSAASAESADKRSPSTQRREGTRKNPARGARPT